jgi:hypothetical protein
VFIAVYFLPKWIRSYERNPDHIEHALDVGMLIQIFGVLFGIAADVIAVAWSWNELSAGHEATLVLVFLTALIGPFLYLEGLLWSVIPVNEALRQLFTEGKQFSRDVNVNRVRRHVRRHRILYRLICRISRVSTDHLVEIAGAPERM